MHTVWKGSISFGLVNVPVKMHAATETQEFHFNYLHQACHNRVRYTKKCPHCDIEVAAEDIVKGYEYEKDRYVILDDEDLASLEKPMSRSIDILDFIALAEIDPIYYQKSYYLSPEETAQKAYRLLCQAMADTGKVAVAKLTMRSKQHLACLRVVDENIMVLETMYYPAEIRHLESTWDKVSPTEIEIEMARQLIENLAAPFEPEKYKDELREQVKELIQKKVAGETFSVTAAPEPGKVIDLMEALRASIAITDQQKGKLTDEDTVLPNVDEAVQEKTTKIKEKPKKSISKEKTDNEEIAAKSNTEGKAEGIRNESDEQPTESTLTRRRRPVRRAKGA
jgi:DNA end-binding protein Ku